MVSILVCFFLLFANDYFLEPNLENSHTSALSPQLLHEAKQTQLQSPVRIVLLGAGGHVKNTGAYRLFIFLKERGIQTELLDNSIPEFCDKFYDYYGDFDTAINTLVRTNPPFVGVSLLSHDLAYYTKLFDKLRQRNPNFIENSIFIFGGPAVNNDPSYIFDIMKKVGLKNIIVSPGRGEGKLDKMVQCTDKKDIVSLLKKMPGIIARIDGETINSLLEGTEKDEDSYFSQEKYYAHLLTETASSQHLILPNTGEYSNSPAEFIYLDLFCQAGCKFCSYSIRSFHSYVKSTRLKPQHYQQAIEEVLDFIVKSYRIKGVRKILITSDDIFADTRFLKLFIEQLLAIHSQIPEMTFWGTGRPFQVVQEIPDELLSQMHKVGFTHVTLGTESFHANFLKEMGKGSTVSINEEAIKKLYRAGIKTCATMLPFYPSVTREYLIHDLKTVARLYEQYHIYIAFHPTLIAIQNTSAYNFFQHQVEFESITLSDGSAISIPQYILPIDTDMKKFQMILNGQFKEIQGLIKAVNSNIHMDRTFDALIFLTILSELLNDKTLFDTFYRFLMEFCMLYPQEYRIPLQNIMRNKIFWDDTQRSLPLRNAKYVACCA